MLCTVFKNLKSIKDPHYRTVDFMLSRIKDGNSKQLIEKIRNEDDKDRRNELKMNLPSVLFSGKFKERNINGLIKHSGFICLDFDNIDNRELLGPDEYIYACWLSPSGTGVKALIRIPTDDHFGSFQALQKRYPELDRSCKDVCRVCYESYDPDIHINKDALVFTDKVHVSETMTSPSDAPSEDKAYELIKKWLDKKGEYYTKGNRNNYIFRLASACLRFGIGRDRAEELIRWDFLQGADPLPEKEFQTIMTLYDRYAGSFATAEFEYGEMKEKQEGRLPLGAKIIELDDLDVSIPEMNWHVPMDADYLKKIAVDGSEMGEETYYGPELDERWRWKKGQVNLFHGLPNHGKSDILLQLVLSKCYFDDKRFIVFSPESGEQGFYKKCIEKMAGGVLGPDSWQLGPDTVDQFGQWVREHIFLINSNTEDPTPDAVLEQCARGIAHHQIDGILIDPFNEMTHIFGQRQDQYLSRLFRSVKQFVRVNELYFVWVAHPKSLSGRELADDKLSTRIPSYYDISGGSMWPNKMDNICAIHRPFLQLAGATNDQKKICIFETQKVKVWEHGFTPGRVEFNFDVQRKWHILDGYTPLSTVGKIKIDTDEDLPF
jgi:hypothetical protein